MAGHSQFKNIMHRKGAQDRKRAREFARASREITVAARVGNSGDPDSNARLRTAISSARAVNMPRDNIERAIQKGTGALGDGTQIEEIRYEGYGPEGVAVIVDTVTDNRNRSGAAVRTAFNKFGGNLGTTGSVVFQFNRCAGATIPTELTEDALTDIAIELDANELEYDAEQKTVTFLADADQLSILCENVLARFEVEPVGTLVWRPVNTIEITGGKAASVLRLINALDDLDDVQSVVANFTIPDDQLADVLARL